MTRLTFVDGKESIRSSLKTQPGRVEIIATEGDDFAVIRSDNVRAMSRDSVDPKSIFFRLDNGVVERAEIYFIEPYYEESLKPPYEDALTVFTIMHCDLESYWVLRDLAGQTAYVRFRFPDSIIELEGAAYVTGFWLIDADIDSVDRLPVKVRFQLVGEVMLRHYDGAIPPRDLEDFFRKVARGDTEGLTPASRIPEEANPARSSFRDWLRGMAENQSRRLFDAGWDIDDRG